MESWRHLRVRSGTSSRGKHRWWRRRSQGCSSKWSPYRIWAITKQYQQRWRGSCLHSSDSGVDMSITFTEKGSFNNTERYLSRLQRAELFAVLNKYGTIGVNALSNATPTETGATAHSWSYTV